MMILDLNFPELDLCDETQYIIIQILWSTGDSYLKGLFKLYSSHIISFLYKSSMELMKFKEMC